MTGQLANQILWVGDTLAAGEGDRPGSELALSDRALVALDQVEAALAYLTAGHRVDGIVLNLATSPTAGLASLGKIQAQAPDVPVIVLVSPDQVVLGLEAVWAGAEDYLIGEHAADIKRALDCALVRRRRPRSHPATEARPEGEPETLGQADEAQHYPTIFRGVPVSLWQEDWSLQRQGATDLAAYIDQHPELVTQAIMQMTHCIATLGNWDYDLLNDRLNWSEDCYRLAGMATDQPLLTYADFLQYVHPDDLDWVKPQLDQAIRDRAPLHYEHRWICPRGEVRHLNHWGQITYDSHGKPLRLVGTLQNVTERVCLDRDRQRVEAMLRQQAMLLTSAERIGNMGSWALDLSTNHLVWSAGTYRLFGLRPEEPIESFERFIEWVLPEDRSELLNNHTKVGTLRGILEVNYRIRRPDGEIRWLSDRGNIEVDSEGQPCRQLGMVIDVTAQKTAEATLRASEERFRLVSKATNDAIWDWDLITDVTWRGEGYKTLFGYGNEDLESHNDWWRDRLHPDDRQRLLASIQTAIEGEATIWMVEYRFRCRDGHYAYVKDRGYVIRNAQGQAMRMIGGMLNLTQQKNLEAQLLQSQKMEAIGQLTGGVAHDFNNLLTVILGNAELLVELLDTQPQLRSLADMISSAAQRGADLTQRLLVFARRQILDPKPVDVNQLIDRMDALLRRVLGEQIEVRCSYAADLELALVDASQLENALLNLCLNARDAMDGVGCLTLTTAHTGVISTVGDPQESFSPGDYVMVTVSDNGVGMGPELLSQVFEPFFTTKAKGKGTGLGLSMVYGFVHQSNGYVNIDSEPGVGTTVQLYLPHCRDRPRPPLDRRDPDFPPEVDDCPGGSELILLVEDNTLVRDYAQQQLEGLGYRVLAAENGPAALELLHQWPEIDLLFTDVIMPGGMNGRDLAAAAHRLRPHLRVLYTSGYTENALIPQGAQEPKIQLLAKPYQRAELARHIRQALAKG
ncbi:MULTISPECIES: PAS domain-containing protein [Cyanophyceae]|uniref:PAS domain-containing protein n=1 Tax=Cyanophyceae TaxID=3028117 RepID=UPI001684CC1A|nr:MULTISPECIES: PAS domain-containing protein [Cyanophyceae]MBD1917396.1 PAS domain-containing protein [Phormidium sp. FACHB-77]MBD2032359.1 PAS domain-containing protein [Phormidium sp. FACHB-322]MBD2052297.1 PAS domain-containing protein [Leptolyngbya sp. FACHB-60]